MVVMMMSQMNKVLISVPLGSSNGDSRVSMTVEMRISVKMKLSKWWYPTMVAHLYLKQLSVSKRNRESPVNLITLSIGAAAFFSSSSLMEPREKLPLDFCLKKELLAFMEEPALGLSMFRSDLPRLAAETLLAEPSGLLPSRGLALLAVIDFLLFLSAGTVN